MYSDRQLALRFTSSAPSSLCSSFFVFLVVFFIFFLILVRALVFYLAITLVNFNIIGVYASCCPSCHRFSYCPVFRLFTDSITVLLSVLSPIQLLSRFCSVAYTRRSLDNLKKYGNILIVAYCFNKNKYATRLEITLYSV